MARLTATILGCGSSGGVPRLGGHWGACDPANPRNRRLRCSVLMEREEDGDTTRVLVDTSPDLRQQLLTAGVGELDGVIYTHGHADHVHGIDDLRMIVFNMRRRLPVWADAPTSERLMATFGYVFQAPEGSPYPPICDLRPLDGPAEVGGPGGTIRFEPFAVGHGAMPTLGFRIGGMAYVPDVVEIPDAAWPMLEGLDVLVIDALRRTPHPTHAHLDMTLGWIERAAPDRAVLTNMHIDMDYEEVARDTPAHVEPAHDGLRIELAP